ncbi:MAG TPA: prepilin-type N-terminal cleavage/methylation domain-containing protein [Longimicrobiales bacterium]|jgi:general secretion pathway protein G
MSTPVNRDVRPRGMGSAGFTLIEMVLVVVIVGILMAIVVPNYRAIQMKARAASILGDISVIEQAVRDYQADLLSWPADAAAGAIPGGLGPFLPTGFTFAGEEFVLDWDNFAVPAGLPGDPGTTRILGVGVVTDNEMLGNALLELSGTRNWFVTGSSYIRIIERT